MKRVLTFGTFDIFHLGHLRILERAASHGNELVVGISSDKLNFKKKGRKPFYTEDERMHIISSLDFVNEVFLEESLELKREYLLEHKADCLIMGCDWTGKFDEFSDICEVIYLPRTPDISTTELIEKIKTL
ncbi:adenylyltransferase/cytidyltransferase family protein [Poseidonibacter lekithochrous]|uniref:adenylyltransferase/cytidyltransferase family protein n=1 Tax=Poseidonibacter lekithochrous TaxID=1904463 RepID=UPI0008FC5FAB|nr:adenylyltransferase/cytidyltransferase family protein [Poseidonibacter lekithochrous]QKJ23273.1 glycerol-3-phosphate cytidylyltransferase [Poseidonibacter lekithochrous]